MPWTPRALGRLAAGALLLTSGSAYELNPDSTDSIKSIAKNMADDLLSFYDGDEPGGTPGLLPQPYYWWEAGAMLGALVDYWYYTNDDSYNKLITDGLLFQVGENADYMPRNQTLTEGNDDQGFWGLAVMSAAENRFPDPPADKPQWLALAQAVFNTQAARWDESECGGGLRWQIFHWNKGFDYKNSISQACFFALGARLALYTGNHTYAEWADRTWDWMVNVKFIDEYWRVFDGAHIGTNCTNIVPYQFSYNAGGFLLGAAAMYNLTDSPKWKRRLDKLLEGSKVFFTGPDKNIMTEVACEPVDRCNLDQQSYKVIMPYLRASAVAAAKQCVGGANGRMCGLKWNQDKYDGSTGVGQQMAAMEVTLSCMVKQRAPPLTEKTGGTSKGSPGAGGDDIGREHPPGPIYKPLTAGDRAGAAAITVLAVAGMFAGMFWIFLDESSDKGPLDQCKGFCGAVLHRTRGGDYIYNEKSPAVVSSVSERALRSSSEINQAAERAPAETGRTRRQSQGQRSNRLSNMPIGWPHNPSLRPASGVESGRSRATAAPDGDGDGARLSKDMFLAQLEVFVYTGGASHGGMAAGCEPVTARPRLAICMATELALELGC